MQSREFVSRLAATIKTTTTRTGKASESTHNSRRRRQERQIAEDIQSELLHRGKLYNKSKTTSRFRRPRRPTCAMATHGAGRIRRCCAHVHGLRLRGRSTLRAAPVPEARQKSGKRAVALQRLLGRDRRNAVAVPDCGTGWLVRLLLRFSCGDESELGPGSDRS